MFTRRMTVIVGRFGSGKTEIAVNGAMEVARRGDRVTLVDLDVVKPYFRSRALSSAMAGRGVRVVAPEEGNPFTDLPLVSPEVRGLLVNGGQKVIVDVGGDPVGALVLGATSDAVPKDEAELLLVLNFARPQTETVAQAMATARAIQAAARLPITGLVANTHLLSETTSETVIDGLRLTEQTAAALGLPVAFVAVEERLVGSFPVGWAACPVLPLRRMVFPPSDALPRQPGATRFLSVVPRGLAQPRTPARLLRPRATIHTRVIRGA